MSQPVLSLTGISKRYRAGVRGCSASVNILRAIHLRVHAGDLIGVVGGRGMGKSTLLLCAAGLVRPDTGAVVRASGAAHPMDGGCGLGYVPEHPVYYPFLTVREVIEGYAPPTSANMHEHRRRLQWAIRAAALGEQLRERVGSGSSSLCRQVAFALALVARPKLLLLDETLSELAPGAHAVLAGTLRVLSARGTATVITAREPSVLQGVATRCVMLVDGVLRGAGSALPGRERGTSSHPPSRPVPLIPAMVAERAPP